jgi:methylthioribose-1-phosphate isomerase
VEPVVAVSWSPDGRAVRIIDQRALPDQYVERDVSTVNEIRDCIRTLAVRGAPAIGVFAAMGIACVMQQHAELPREEFDHVLDASAERVRASRPTARNLGWAIDRLLAGARATSGDALGAAHVLRRTAEAIRAEDRDMCQRIGEHALTVLPNDAHVLTLCNTGALATAGIGTALAPLYLAHARGQRLHVYVCETRPLLQGSRLTAWELGRAGIPLTLLVDGAAPALLRSQRVDCILVGADRIAANGDVANKIGTYGLALSARHHGVPFYVAAPSSTIDGATASGGAIPIEQRDPNEVRAFRGASAAPADADAFNPAFDVTPQALISAIVTDRAVHRPPYDFSSVAA